MFVSAMQKTRNICLPLYLKACAIGVSAISPSLTSSRKAGVSSTRLRIM